MRPGGPQGTAASRGLRSAGWLLPFLLLACAALVSSAMVHGSDGAAGGRGRKDGRPPGLLEIVSIRPYLSFVFRNFLADIVWLEAVQTAGSRRMAREDYDRLFRLIRAVANFDPRFVVPYILGGLILGDSPHHAREAIETLRRGYENHPADWRFPFYIGYTEYFTNGNPEEGGKYLQEASKLPHSPPHLPFLASRMLSEGRKPEIAIDFLREMIEQETDPARREILYRRAREVAVERDLQALEDAVGKYRAREGRAPGTLSDLVRAGLIRAVPQEPNGGHYLLAPDGSVRSDRVSRRLKVFRFR